MKPLTKEEAWRYDEAVRMRDILTKDSQRVFHRKKILDSEEFRFEAPSQLPKYEREKVKLSFALLINLAIGMFKQLLP